jgi:spore coat protein U-like protein
MGRIAATAAFAWACGAEPSGAVTCVANATNIAFGSLGVGALANATTSGTIYEGCSGGWQTRGNLSTCIAIGAGANSVSQTNRTMTNGAYSISYNLYSDTAMSTPYADPGADSFYIPYSTSSGGYTTTTTYAKILSAASGIAPGTYTDTYSTTAQSFIDFDTWNTTYPPITCGLNPYYTGLAATFTVSVTVLASCSIAASNLNFGSASVLSANVDATSNLTVTCTNTTPYTVALGPGSGTGATTSHRSMTGTSGSVGYALYQDAARSVNWGNTPPPAANADTASGVGTGSAQTLTVYGRVPPQTTPKQGAYSDTVIVTLTY